MECTEIEELLPQKPPFMMVDKLVKYESEEAETIFAVREDNVMLQDGVLSSAGLMENIAQTSAARIGYYYKYILKEPVKVGYIGAVKNMKVTRYPAVGECLHTHIHVIAEAFGMVAFVAVISDADGHAIARGEMKTAI